VHLSTQIDNFYEDIGRDKSSQKRRLIVFEINVRKYVQYLLRFQTLKSLQYIVIFKYLVYKTWVIQIQIF